MVAARAGTTIDKKTTASAIEARRPGFITHSLFQLGGDVLGVLLMTLEDLQAGLQQALELGIAGGRNELSFQRAVDRLVIGDLVGDIGLVEGRAAQLVEFG